MFKRNLLVMAIATLPLTANADIIKATLYPSHGDLIWQEVQTVNQGSGMVTIEQLPISLQDQSLQVSISGLEGAHIRQVQVDRVEQTDYVAGQTQRLQEELATVQERIQTKEDAIQAWNQQVTLMTSAAENPHQRSASELNDMAVALKQTTQEALAEIRSVRSQMRDDIALQDRLQRELAQARQSARATKTAQIYYQAPIKGELSITLRFQSNEARWRSEYNAYLQSQSAGQKEGELTLQHLAVVQQTTGTDWRNVELELSTANARRGTSMPPLSSWVVQPELSQKFEREMDAAAPLFKSRAESAAVADSLPSVQRQSTFTQSYRLPQPVIVPHGDSSQRFTVAEHALPVQAAVWTAPAIDPTGYVHATGLFKAEAPIPAGPAQLFRDGQSVGRAQLPDLTDGEELRLGFGVDAGTRVVVINEIERSGEEGIWNSENVQRRQNRYEITNHHDEPITVRIFDRLPVSQLDILTVKPLTISEPVERDVDDKKGVLAWNRDISAGQTISVQSGFELRVPEGNELPEL